ncbi:hypothetical protein B0H63DRAFT_559244 [Podospora didyma]|uniref:Uncharacterized protein n=1 Tax=Podospora didyma TaxID=330526 RepID=A0AAE0NU52_9PEZI|nr:hypothetical protein B0H63DRAFT_559244 [Podospora didyma]
MQNHLPGSRRLSSVVKFDTVYYRGFTEICEELHLCVVGIIDIFPPTLLAARSDRGFREFMPQFYPFCCEPEFAQKTFSPGSYTDFNTARSEFLTELKIMDKLSPHDHVIRPEGTYSDDRGFYLLLAGYTTTTGIPGAHSPRYSAPEVLSRTNENRNSKTDVEQKGIYYSDKDVIEGIGAKITTHINLIDRGETEPMLPRSAYAAIPKMLRFDKTARITSEEALSEPQLEQNLFCKSCWRKLLAQGNAVVRSTSSNNRPPPPPPPPPLPPSGQPAQARFPTPESRSEPPPQTTSEIEEAWPLR